MSIRLFDVQTGFGGIAPGESSGVSVADLAGEMARLDIAKALVRTYPDELLKDVFTANEALYAACRKHPGMAPCPIIVPDTGYETPPVREQIGRAISEGAGAVVLRPEQDHWSLAEWASGSLFEALAERRMPAYCDTRAFSLDQVGDLADQYPGVPLILAGAEYRQDRTMLPLLSTFHNVYLSIGSNYTVHKGVERFVERVGAGRLLFGTGFPDIEPMMAVALLMYADIPEDARQHIGADNFERLMGGIRR